MYQVYVKFCEGNVRDGFSYIAADFHDGEKICASVMGHLPSALDLYNTYQEWRSNYQRFCDFRNYSTRIKIIENQVNDYFSIDEFKVLNETLKQYFNSWLESESFLLVRERLIKFISQHNNAQIIFQTDDLTLCQLPWNTWNIIEDFPEIEISFSNLEFETIPITRPIKNNNQVKILAVIGDSQNLDLNFDQSIFKGLHNSNYKILVEPKIHEIVDTLWSDSWDILYFAGHSASYQDKGVIYINSNEELKVNEWRLALQQAISKGLQLAIFNSCDGLGLAYELGKLSLPYAIVMRESIPDIIAHKFLEFFLKSFANGSSLHLATREAREQLEGYESQYPFLSSIPVIYQNLGFQSLTWDYLRQRHNCRINFNNLSNNLLISGVFCIVVTSIFFLLRADLIFSRTISQKLEENPIVIETTNQTQTFTIFGVSQEIHKEAVKQSEKARKEVEQLKRDGSLSATAKRILAEAEEADDQGDNQRYLEKIQEYRQILNDEPIKRAAEAWILEGRALFSQLQLKEAQNAIEEAIKLDSNNPKYLLTLAEYLRWNGKYQKMKEVSVEAISLIKNQESRDEILLAEGLSTLGGAYLLGGNYDLAIIPLQQSLEIRQKVLGQEHPDVATSLNNLANLYYSQGRYSEAEPLYLQALELRKQLLGESHPDVASSFNNLAGLYSNQGRYEEAESLYLQSLELRKKLLGESHPDVASSLNNLAVIYDNQGRYEEAESLYLQALELRKKLLGESHPDVASSLNNLAVIYDNQGRYEEAESLYLQALELRKKLLGESHPTVANNLNNLALLYSSQERYSEAEPLYLQALELRKKLLGESHPDVASILNNLAGLYSNQGRYSEAEPLYLQSLELRKKLLGELHPTVATSLNNLAGLYSNQGRYEEAESLYQKALTIAEATLGTNHSNYIGIRKGLQKTLDKMQD